jgi:hypothetical protein
MIRVVLDTNIFISALLQPQGLPAQTFLMALAGATAQLCVSQLSKLNVTTEAFLSLVFDAQRDERQKTEGATHKPPGLLRRFLRRKWLCYFLIGAASLSVGCVLFLNKAFPYAWHLVRGDSANFHQWKVPVPKEWWAYTRQGTLIISNMQKSADLDSHVVVSDLPDKGSYDEEKFKRSLIENYTSRKEYRLGEERKTRLGAHEGYCLFFPSVSNAERLLVACEIPDDKLSVNFDGNLAYISNFNLILQRIALRD